MGDIQKERDLQKDSTVKLPWQMTKAEYEAIHGAPKVNSTVTGYFSRHKNAVEVALNRGLPVPEIVLKDYPELSEN